MTPEDRYNLKTLLAHRHKSELWLAEDHVTGEDVLLKLFGRWTQEYQSFRFALMSEAPRVQQMNHPQLARVLDYGELNGRDFLVTEYVRGETLYSFFLRMREERKNLPYTLVVRWILQIGSLLDYVKHFPHSEAGLALGLMHRRLLMDQIVITPQLEIKVLGFGTPRHLTHLDAQTVQQYRRPWRYLPQDVIRGEQRLQDSHNDLYVLGLLLYELTTGCKAFRSGLDDNITALTEISNVVYGRLLKPSELREDFPPSLLRMIGFAMHPDPAQRFATIPDFLNGLSLFLALSRVQSWHPDSVTWMQNARECLHDNDLATILGMLRLGGEESTLKMFEEYLWEHLKDELLEPLKQGEPLAWPQRELLSFLPVSQDACRQLLQSNEVPECTRLELVKSIAHWPSEEATHALSGAFQGSSATVAWEAHHVMEQLPSPPPLAWKEEELQILPCPHRWESLVPVANEPFNRIRYCEVCGVKATRVQDVDALQRLAGEHCVSFTPDQHPSNARLVVHCMQEFWTLTQGENLRFGAGEDADFQHPQMVEQTLVLTNRGQQILELQYEGSGSAWTHSHSMESEWEMDLELLLVRNEPSTGHVIVEVRDEATLTYLQSREHLTGYVPAIQNDALILSPLPEEAPFPEEQESREFPDFLVLRESATSSVFLPSEEATAQPLEVLETQERMFLTREDWQRVSPQHPIHEHLDAQEDEALLSEPFQLNEPEESSGFWSRIRRFFGGD